MRYQAYGLDFPSSWVLAQLDGCPRTWTCENPCTLKARVHTMWPHFCQDTRFKDVAPERGTVLQLGGAATIGEDRPVLTKPFANILV